MFVVPLVAATCFVAVLNGSVLCIAGGDHVAVEAAHEEDCCTAARDDAGRDRPAPQGGDCSDVSADLDLQREWNRNGDDTVVVSAPWPWAGEEPSLRSDHSPFLPHRRSTAAPPAWVRKRVVESVVLLI